MPRHFPGTGNPLAPRWPQLRPTRLPVALALVVLISALASEVRALAPSSVVGYPRCTVDEVADSWIWYDGDEVIGTSSEPVLEYGGTTHQAESDCTGVAECLSVHPETSGRAATLVGGPSDDHLIGTPGRDLIVGLGGDDELVGRGGRDTICGGPGADTIDGGASDDLIYAGAGDDIARGKRGDDVIRMGPGSDVVFAGTGQDVVRGGKDDDWALGGNGQDEIDGGPGDDACFGGRQSDTVRSCRVRSQGGVHYGGNNRIRTRIVVDTGVTVAPERFAAQVDRTLGDPRSWLGGDTTLGFERVSKDPDLRVILALPERVDELCYPLRTGGVLSCRNGDNVVINLDRWNLAVAHWTAPLLEYRHYVVNHEVGHFLGHGHTGCPGTGQLAPVMMQQTKGLDGCTPNGWPYP